jgi:hypothetical protein
MRLDEIVLASSKARGSQELQCLELLGCKTASQWFLNSCCRRGGVVPNYRWLRVGGFVLSAGLRGAQRRAWSGREFSLVSAKTKEFSG